MSRNTLIHVFFLLLASVFWIWSTWHFVIYNRSLFERFSMLDFGIKWVRLLRRLMAPSAGKVVRRVAILSRRIFFRQSKRPWFYSSCRHISGDSPKKHEAVGSRKAVTLIYADVDAEVKWCMIWNDTVNCLGLAILKYTTQHVGNLISRHGTRFCR